MSGGGGQSYQVGGVHERVLVGHDLFAVALPLDAVVLEKRLAGINPAAQRIDRVGQVAGGVRVASLAASAGSKWDEQVDHHPC